MLEKQQKKITINKELCKGCELCVFYCPKKCLKLADEFNSAGHHPVILIKPEDCIYCGVCYIMCPDYVFSIIQTNKK